MLQQIILMLHVLICVALIGLVLIQHGKGADVGAAFGGGASQTVFGSQGAGSFMFKLTAGIAFLFFLTSLILTSMTAHLVKTNANTDNSPLAAAMEKTTQPATQTPAKELKIPAKQPVTVPHK